MPTQDDILDLNEPLDDIDSEYENIDYDEYSIAMSSEAPIELPSVPDDAFGVVYDWDNFEEEMMAAAQEGRRISQGLITDEVESTVSDEFLQDPEKILDGLNPEQREAAMATEGPVMVIAGAGAGKTATLTRRVALLMARGVQPGNILVLTFTNAAAAEIKERIEGFVGEMGQHVVSGTFHSVLFNKIIQENINSPYLDSLGINPLEIAIIDEEESKKYLREAIKEVDVDYAREIEENEWTDKDFRTEMGLARSVGMTHQEYFNTISPTSKDSIFQRVTAEVWKIYTEKVRSMNGIDFDDVLVVAAGVVENEPDYAQMLANQFKYINLDEYQDTNPVQMRIMDAIAKYHNNIFVVGDEKQSIYKFRGADINVILGFKDRYKNAQQITMPRNYRSAGPIIDLANSIATEMPQKQSDGQLLAMSEHPHVPPVFCTFKNDRAEAQAVVMAIKRDIMSGAVEPQEVMIAYRENKMSKLIAEELIMADIPYEIKGDTDFYKRAEVKSTIAMIRFLSHTWDSSAAIRLLENISISASPKALHEAMTENKLNAFNAFKKMSEEVKKDGSPTNRAIKCKHFVNLVESVNDVIYEKAVSPERVGEIMTEFFDIYIRPKIKSEKKNDNDQEGAEKDADKIGRIKIVIKQFVADLKAGATIDEAIVNLSLKSDESVEKQPSVRLMTHHGAKGLESDHVYLVQTGTDNPQALLEDYDELNEARRVGYVAASRAKKKLVISMPKYSLRFGKTVELKPVPWLQELIDNKSIKCVNSYRDYEDPEKVYGKMAKPNNSGSSAPSLT